MQNSESSFAAEVQISPHPVLATFVVLGLIIYFVSDSIPDGNRLLQFSGLILISAGSAWLADSRWPGLGARAATLALILLIVLADLWLHLPGALFLLGIPAILALALLGFREALVTTILITCLLSVLSITSVVHMTEASMVCALAWATLAVLYLWQQRSYQLSQWSWRYYQYAQGVLETARNERMAHKQLEADLLLANRELARLSSWLKAMHQFAEEARQTKERFVANVSHELRTPLNMIISFSDIISRSSAAYGVSLPPALLADLAAIQRNSQHLAKLVDDVLDLSQIESDRMALHKEWTSLAAIIDQAVTAVHALYVAKQLYLKTDVPPDLPRLYCDSTRIRQVLINLLSNAGRFTETGGVCVAIRREPDAVCISVTDTGSGIAPEDQQHIFEPFYQVDSSLRRTHGGSGLGLSISKQFVEMHRGKMWLVSELGVGTTIAFSLPLQPPLPATFVAPHGMRYNPYAQFEGRTEQFTAPAPRVMPRFVLLDAGDTLQRMFTHYREDVEIVAVQTPADARQALSQTPAHALILNSASFADLPMPTAQLTNLPYSTPLISCWVAGEHRSRPPLGATRYLVKPVTREALLTTLAELGEAIETVLLVDDDHEFLQLFARMLATAARPYRVLQTTSGQRALSLLRERRPDVMLLDLMMPKMDGFHVLAQKQQDPALAEIPVVVISAKDPNGQPIVSDQLAVTYPAGLSADKLMACVQALSNVLAPDPPTAGQVHLEKRVG